MSAKGRYVRASPQRCGLTRSFTRGYTRPLRLWLVLLACLAQLWMPVQHGHAPGFATHAMASSAVVQGSDTTLVSIDEGQTGIPCALHGTRASADHGNNPPPCNNGDYPSCAFCPCCALMQAAMGIFPQELAHAGYAPLISAFAATPAILGTVTRFAAYPGQPRAPPVLI
jgi:hypothetical protein